MKGLYRPYAALALGVGAMLSTPVVAAPLSPGVAAEANKLSCDDVTGITSMITQVLTATPDMGVDLAASLTQRCPEDAAAIATAAVNADPNAATDIVYAIIAALPEQDRDNPLITTAITPLGRFQPPAPPGPGSYPDAPLIAPWTDPRSAAPLVNGPTSSPL